MATFTVRISVIFICCQLGRTAKRKRVFGENAVVHFPSPDAELLFSSWRFSRHVSIDPFPISMKRSPRQGFIHLASMSSAGYVWGILSLLRGFGQLIILGRERPAGSVPVGRFLWAFC
jgi:hypothetical protein